MLSFYLYGVVVLIAIVLLIVFNVRAAKKRSDPKKPEQPQQPTLEVKNKEKKEEPTAAKQPSKTSEPVQSDGDYRQALLQFQTKDESTDENQGKDDSRINDASYREGLRAMHKRE